MTQRVEDKLKALLFELVPVPANMTNFFQQLDLTVNGSAKKFMKNCFTQYYCNAIKEQLDSGKELDGIDVDFRLSTIKPIHANWLVSMYNYLTTKTRVS